MAWDSAGPRQRRAIGVRSASHRRERMDAIPGATSRAPGFITEFRQVVSRFNGLSGPRIDNSGMRIRLCVTLLAPACRADSLDTRVGGSPQDAPLAARIELPDHPAR